MAISSGRVAGSQPPVPDARRRLWILLTLCAVAMLLAGGYTAFAVRRARNAATSAPRLAVREIAPERPFLMVRSTASDDTWKRLVLVPLEDPAGAAYVTTLSCERAYFAGNRGVCLVEEPQGLVTRHYADIFDDHFTRTHRVPLTGLPSRARVSQDGRRAAVTVFESGHSYAEAGFSTRTTIVDTGLGRTLSDLEQFTIWRDGKPFRAVDFNFWGVTFEQDGNRFYATLASRGTKYLIEGDVDRREGRILKTGVECPSLSPDNTRIAYKSLIGGMATWQLRIYDLRDGSDVPLTLETRSVDDQVDWLDNEHVMYHVSGSRGADIWVLRTNNTEPPRILRLYAYSPAVVR